MGTIAFLHGSKSDIGVKNTINDAYLDEKDGLPGLAKRVLMAGSHGMMDEKETIGEIMVLQRFFITNNERYLCIVPEGTMLGDRSFVIAGCNLHLMLRAHERATKDLKGRCYMSR
ncbi:heterokaryon incompatibility protein [Colletotrichum scovillei]|uniref:Heterokaryon incompatibility protein n=1 Tax=Colletotrichum scovillei TaxID=1209932 RepID=A0A9P7R353_9PEZI|nr:heterokaryon incompatibility protein [Colletotrichum scovillei]KAG7059670.1 heterokaryon incompatibility protein [Colletotrichum scovillei]KAG7067120.1 heterokaryon incompatibility protein [Colletotrichum scovillei]